MHGPPFILFIGEARQILNYNRQFEVMPGSGTDRCTGCGGVEDSFNSSIDIEAKLKLHAMLATKDQFSLMETDPELINTKIKLKCKISWCELYHVYVHVYIRNASTMNCKSTVT